MINKMGEFFGSFTVTDDRVIVTDPCYNGDNESGMIVRAVPGIWNAYCAYNDYDRVVRLTVVNTDYEYSKYLKEGEFIELTYLPVDSGQMCVCNCDKFVNAGSEYEKYCNATSSDESCGIIEDYAAVSSTGWGDGQYALYGAYLGKYGQEDPQYYALSIEFIPEDEEDDDDEEW